MPAVAGLARRRPGWTIADGYGQTETGHLDRRAPGRDRAAGSMGRALPGVAVEIVDGELTVDPATVPTFFLGYDGAPRARRRWRTGDQVRQDDDGWLFFEARADDVIISAGYRIGPAEVESTLQGHPAVRECAVIGVPDEARGSIVVRGGRVAGRIRRVGRARARAAGAREGRDRAVQIPAAESASWTSCPRRTAARSTARPCGRSTPPAPERAGYGPATTVTRKACGGTHRRASPRMVRSADNVADPVATTR